MPIPPPWEARYRVMTSTTSAERPVVAGGRPGRRALRTVGVLAFWLTLWQVVAMAVGQQIVLASPVEVVGRKGAVLVSEDEQPSKADPAKIPTLKPAFAKDGAITAANASSISDGAAALVMTRESVARKLGMTIVARVAAHAAHAQEPSQFATAPVPAIRKVLQRAGWNIADVDLFEVNEAFAVVAMVAQRDLGIDPARLNVNGGACALGHPIGASGARILTTLMAALEARGGKRGVAALCIGGGEATAMAIELA